jgi:hypothetical protein
MRSVHRPSAVGLLVLFGAACSARSSGVHDAAPTDGSGGDATVTAVGVSIAVDHSVRTAKLDSTFAGLSYEKSVLATPLFSAGNAPLVALFQRLGAGVLRVGGNSVDRTTWVPMGAGLTLPSIAPADVDRLAGFLRAVNWKVIYGVNMAASTPAAAATEASYAATSLGDRLYGLEIGNEPDVYKNKYRPATWTYASFRAEWEMYAAAVHTQVPTVALTGPASASHYQTYTVPFAADEASRIALLTQHWYLANGMDPTSTIDKLLMPDPALATELAGLAGAARGAAIADGFRLAECNSYYNGGSSGVSDSFASALWVIDFLFATAAGGASGVNLHGGGNGPGYTPIANDAAGKVVGARPEYYGVALFAMAASGELIGASVGAGAPALQAWAVDGTDGTTSLILVNKSRTDLARATIDFGRAVSTVELTTLIAPALESTSGVLLGGAPIAADGSWNPGALPTVPSSGSSATVDVAPASAALLRAR